MDFDGDYLSESAVAALTGEVVPALQAAILARSGFPFIYTGVAVRLLRLAVKGHKILREAGPEGAAPPSN